MKPTAKKAAFVCVTSALILGTAALPAFFDQASAPRVADADQAIAEKIRMLAD
ncbi:MAG: hypothetical protein HUJ54_06300, partial [Erysipelotrichaceae bacterium]|nr:hypothetical protein [Erysipelotrichaceae bacterium]